jgi:hypothetical protein
MMRRLGLLLIYFAVAFPTAGSAGTYAFHSASTLKLGGTFDSQNLSVAYPSCIRYEREYAVHKLGRKDNPPPPPGTDPTNVAASNELTIEQIKTREHLYKFLHISTSISGQYKLFSASGSLDYESEETFDSDSFVFGVRGITTFGEVGLIDPVLTETAKALVKDRSAFYVRCGREWVSTETRGVLIAVIYTIKNVSQSQRSKLEAAVSGGFNGGVLSIDVQAKLKQIFETAFVSNYYSARVSAIGGAGVSAFAQTLTQLDKPDEVLQKISDYVKTLDYSGSAPLSFTTGTLDQFLAQSGDVVLFDAYNRRISDLFLQYEEYRARRAQVWKFLTDDNQSVWGSTIDTSAWGYLDRVDEVTSAIEAKAQVCKVAGTLAAQVSLRSPVVPPKGGPAPTDQNATDFVNDFSHGISAKISNVKGGDFAKAMNNKLECTPPGANPDLVSKGRAALCECLKKDDAVFLKERFPIASLPSVKVVHDKPAAFAPRTILYISVTAAEKLGNVVLKDNQGATVVSLKGGVDPENGPVWYGSTLYRDGSGNPPSADKLPFFLEMTDPVGRTFTKPIVITD